MMRPAEPVVNGATESAIVLFSFWNTWSMISSAGGGVKLFPSSHVGLRLDGRVIATFVDASGNAFACTPGACLIALHVNVAWQAEFSAGVVFKFP